MNPETIPSNIGGATNPIPANNTFCTGGNSIPKMRGLREYPDRRDRRRETAETLRRRARLRGFAITAPATGHGLRRAALRLRRAGDALRRFPAAPFLKLRTYAMCALEERRLAILFTPFLLRVDLRLGWLMIPTYGFIKNGSLLMKLTPF